MYHSGNLYKKYSLKSFPTYRSHRTRSWLSAGADVRGGRVHTI